MGDKHFVVQKKKKLFFLCYKTKFCRRKTVCWMESSSKSDYKLFVFRSFWLTKQQSIFDKGFFSKIFKSLFFFTVYTEIILITVDYYLIIEKKTSLPVFFLKHMIKNSKKQTLKKIANILSVADCFFFCCTFPDVSVDVAKLFAHFN